MAQVVMEHKHDTQQGSMGQGSMGQSGQHRVKCRERRNFFLFDLIFFFFNSPRACRWDMLLLTSSQGPASTLAVSGLWKPLERHGEDLRRSGGLCLSSRDPSWRAPFALPSDEGATLGPCSEFPLKKDHQVPSTHWCLVLGLPEPGTKPLFLISYPAVVLSVATANRLRHSSVPTIFPRHCCMRCFLNKKFESPP